MKYKKGDLVLLDDGAVNYGIVLVMGIEEQTSESLSSLYRWIYKFVMLKDQREDWHYSTFVEMHGVKVG